jgi:hypothetical protein
MRNIFLVLILSCFSSLASAELDTATIKTSQLICGAVSCRIYALEHAKAKGTVIKIIGCPAEGARGEATEACTVDVRRDVTHGTVEQAIQQFDGFVSEDDGD